jgi:PAS domain S-box-containing protein
MDGIASSPVTGSSDMLHSVLNTLGGGVIVFDADMRIVEANALSAELLDIPADLIAPGKTWREFVQFSAERGDYGEGSAEDHVQRIMEMLETRDAYSMVRNRPDGAVIEIHGRPIENGYVTRFNDITDQRRKEEALRDVTRSQRRFRQFFELSDDLFGIAGSDGRLHTINEGWSRLLGRATEDISGASLISFVHADDKVIVERAFENLSGGVEATRFKVRLVRGNGDSCWTDWHVTSDRDGQIFCALRDVDSEWHQEQELGKARRTAEEAQQLSATAERVLDEAVEALSDGFILFDADDRVVRYNSKYREMFPFVPDIDEGIGLSFREVLELGLSAGAYADPLSRENPEVWIEQVHRAHIEGSEGNNVVEMADGRWVTMTDRRTADGSRVGIRSDITELVKSERRLRDAIESINDGFVFFDGDDRLAAFNSSWLEEFGDFAERIRVGLTFEEVMRVVAESGAIPEAAGCEDEWVANRLEQRHFEIEFERRYTNGRIQCVSQKRTEEGGSVVVRTDITAIRKAGELLSDAIDSLDAGFVLWDNEDRIVMVNAAFRGFYPEFESEVEPGLSFEGLMELLYEHRIREEGEPPDEKAEWLATRIEQRKGQLGAFEQHHKNGRVFKIAERPTSDGGSCLRRIRSKEDAASFPPGHR